MTNEQAIKIIKEERAWESSERIKDAFDLAIKALEKQVAVSRIIIEGKYFCPKCKNSMKHSGYCGCGQRVY